MTETKKFMRFSQRIGKTEVKNVIQKDQMDGALKNRLFNVVKELIDGIYLNREGILTIKQGFLQIYCDHFGEKITAHSRKYNSFLEHLEYKIFVNDDVWFFYDFIEWLMSRDFYRKEYFHYQFNKILKEEKSAYRLNSENKLIPLTDDVEVSEINESLERTAKYKSVSEHLNNARAAFSNRENPDYVAAVRESVFAIESVAKIITKDQNATLETALKKVPNMNPNLQASLVKLYHFRGDQGGVSHATKEEQDSFVSEHEAKLLVVMSHSIVNYLITVFLEND